MRPESIREEDSPSTAKLPAPPPDASASSARTYGVDAGNSAAEGNASEVAWSHPLTKGPRQSPEEARIPLESRSPEVRRGPVAYEATALLPELLRRGERGLLAEPANDVKPSWVGKLPDEMIRAIRRARAEGATLRQVSEDFGVSISYVSDLCRGDYKPEVGGPMTVAFRQVRGTLREKLRHFAIVPEDPDACYGWSGRTDAQGYALVCFGGKIIHAHRCALEQKLGRRLHPGEVSRHKCHNPPCTNERHLIPGTPADNVRDMVEAGRSLCGTRNPAHRLNPSDVLELRALASRGRVNYCEQGRRYGVSDAAIKKAILGRTWRYLLPAVPAPRTTEAA